MRKINLGAIIFELIELAFIVFLPIPVWAKLIIVFILGFVGGILPFIIIPFVVAGWVWAYIYIWINVQNTGWTIFFMIMLLLFGLDIWATKTAYQNMLPLDRPQIATTKRFAIEMWSITICAFLADIAMLIHLLIF